MSKFLYSLFWLLFPGLLLAQNNRLDAQSNTNSVKALPTTEAANNAFWDSVYEQNHVLDIQIRLTSEAWDKMQPEGGSGPGQRGPGGPGDERRPGPPRRDGGGPPRSDGPPRGDGPPPPGGRDGRRGGGGPPPRGGGPGGGGPGGGGANEFTFVKSELIVDGQKFADSGLRFKGNSSYRFSAGGLKRPMKIDTDRFVDDQELYGRSKFNLSTSSLDSAFMKEKLGYELYRAAGLPTPGVGWANVTLIIGDKKTPLGIYVVIEQVDSRYIVSHQGKKAKGSLLMKPERGDWEYLGEEAAAYDDAGYDIKKGAKDAKQVKRFAEFLKWLEDSSDADFERDIAEQMDLPMLAGYLAATSLLSSADSYVGAPHNYYLLLDKTDSKLRLLPWDVNEAFGSHGSVDQLVDWDINRPWMADRRLLDRLFKTKKFPVLYRSALVALLDEFTEEKVSARIVKFETAIKSHVPKYKAGPGSEGLQMGINGDADGYNTAVERRVLAIKPFVSRRIQSVKAQLAGERKGVTINQRRRR